MSDDLPHVLHRPLPQPLRRYRAATALIAPFAPMILRRRLAKGKEHAGRWREKLGQPTAARPDGPLVMMHGVGVGEVLALRGLITLMRARRPDLSVLVTSSAASSATAFDRNPIVGAVHQFLPLDTRATAAPFWDHWQPDLVIWAEQDLWPGLCGDCAERGIPQAMVNARMNDAAFAKRAKAARLYAAALGLMQVVDAQDDQTAANLGRLGAQGVTCSGSLKPLAPPLADWPKEADALHRQLAGRRVWLAASSHPADEAVALAAHRGFPPQDRPLLIIAPRLPARAAEVLDACTQSGLTSALWSTSPTITPTLDVLVADSFGQMGLWYRLAEAALIGGTFGEVEGHNPWEAARLGCCVLHGPRTANFAADYDSLSQQGGAIAVTSAEDILTALHPVTLATARSAAQLVLREQGGRKAELVNRLLGLVPA